MSMTNEQIQALEASALAATTGDWTADDNFGLTVQCYRTGTNRLLATVNGPNAENDMRFISQASPQNILRVLAERDADKALIAEQAKRIAELEASAPLAAHEQEPVGEVIEQPASLVMDGMVNLDAPTYRNIKGIAKMKRMPLGTKFYANPAPVPAVPMAVAGFDAATAIRACMEEFPESMHDIIEECAQIAENTISINHAAPVPAVPKTISVRTAMAALDDADSVTTLAQAYKMGWNSCVAAIQSGNSAQPVTVPVGHVLVPVEPTTNQWAAGMQAFDSGMDKVTRVHKAMLAAAPKAPDGWIPVSERMPEVGSTVMVFMDKPSQSSTDYAIATFDKYGFSRTKVTHWQSLPDAPKGV